MSGKNRIRKNLALRSLVLAGEFEEFACSPLSSLQAVRMCLRLPGRASLLIKAGFESIVGLALYSNGAVNPESLIL